LFFAESYPKLGLANNFPSTKHGYIIFKYLNCTHVGNPGQKSYSIKEIANGGLKPVTNSFLFIYITFWEKFGKSVGC